MTVRLAGMPEARKSEQACLTDGPGTDEMCLRAVPER